MRPSLLNPLFAEIDSLPGVGSRLSKLYEKLLGGTKVVDLCWHLPSSLIDRRYAPKIADAEVGRTATLTVTIGAHRAPPTRRQPYRIRVMDDTAEMDLVFFHAKAEWLSKSYPEGETRIISGKIERFNDRLQMTHPDAVVRLEEKANLERVEPVYPLTAGLTNRGVAKAVGHALSRCPDAPEWQDPAYCRKQGWKPWKAALLSAHSPDNLDSLMPTDPNRQRLAYDELLSNQLALGLIRLNQRKNKGRSLKGDGSLRHRVLGQLPFGLTASQEEALAEITADLGTPARMLRLLQGDVGSGKTIVAFQAMLIAVEEGHQAAIMAPTEILARQHLETIAPLAEAIGLEVLLLTGRDKGKARQEKLERLADGSTKLAIGTHALFQEDVTFSDLALAVIDEQHRFGVHQRLSLAGKGQAVDVLVMTATPIPRTLLLTSYGDMEVSRLLEKPPGRKPVDTRVIDLERLGDVVAGLRRALDQGRRAYWVCPLVEESEVSDLAAAEDRFETLQQHFGEAVGLIHGKMKAKDKDAAMEAFAQGEVKILVATTVIEVGVNVPEATVMVIEHAERFGLAQLHQLRGRVGRGGEQSSCLLLYQGPLGEVARERLKIMRETDDGFRIAEKDLELRGAGELLGTRQSGMPQFRLADLSLHGDLLAVARDDVRLILERDPELLNPRGEALRLLLYLFERDAAVRYLRSG